jgi:hypothetical protein
MESNDSFSAMANTGRTTTCLSSLPVFLLCGCKFMQHREKIWPTWPASRRQSKIRRKKSWCGVYGKKLKRSMKLVIKSSRQDLGGEGGKLQQNHHQYLGKAE